MEITTMRLADLIKPEKNLRIHTEQQLKEFQRSVKMFGQIHLTMNFLCLTAGLSVSTVTKWKQIPV